MPNLKSALFLMLSLFLGFQSVGSAFADGYYSNCQVVYPYDRDSQGRTCNQMYGIKYGYDGPFVSPACWATYDRAMAAMQRNWACSQSLQQGRCEIFFPLVRDRTGSQCYTNQFGVAMNGDIMRGACFNSLEEAMRRMRENPGCR